MTTEFDQTPANAPNTESTKGALAVYILFLVPLLTVFIAAPLAGAAFIAGGVIAYIKRGENPSEWLQSHYTWQIRTFWVGFIATILCTPLVFIFLGIPLAILIAIWIIVRCVIGMLRLSDRKEIAHPKSWLF